MVAFKAMDITDAKQCACLRAVCLSDTPETSLLLIFMENGTLNVLFFLIFLSTSLCFYLLLQCMFLVFVMNAEFEKSGIFAVPPPQNEPRKVV